ncbi:hypothetical protein MesoLj113b_63140 [Mesorhizobium sp. 113-3-3]|nr:hypothetical protein MesoLj113b_63140 [Mesorhizobium sp. 113-3-3]BCG90649.1 hypothetical protein MesoLj113c_67590 [Mesorhizobium sp. 113-3-9]
MKLLAEQVEASAAQFVETLAARPQSAHLRRHLFFPLAAMVISALECASTLSEAEREQIPGFPADRDDLARLYAL